MELAAYGADDFALTEQLETDPAVMAELGGPRDSAQLLPVHRRRAAADSWWFKIVLADSGAPAGAIGIWDSDLDGAAIFETGWMVLPAMHGRGIASAALGLLLQRVRGEPRYDEVDAFPGVANAASNALCRKAGFALLGERDIDFADRILRCNHWKLDLARSHEIAG